MKIASLAFTGLFALGAALQWNDSDPVLWILGYSAGATLSLASALGRRDFLPNAVAFALFGIWFVSIATSLFGAPQEAFTSFTMQAASHEEPREAVGLALLAGWSAVLAAQARRSL
jgi:hypothetical protein